MKSRSAKVLANVRPELPCDVESISRITELAFRPPPFRSHNEQFIIEGLRRARALTVSLVAELDAQVVGHIAFSPVQISDGSQHWYGLGPIAVIPERQGQGIGRALINAGLGALRALGAEGCVVLGAPKFYGRFGFSPRPECVLEGVPPEHFQSLTFGHRSASGVVKYHEAFQAKC